MSLTLSPATDGRFVYYFNGGVVDVPIFGDTIVTFAHGDLYGYSASAFHADRFQLLTSNYNSSVFEYTFKTVGPYLAELCIDRTSLSFAGTYFIRYGSPFYPSFTINVICESIFIN